MNTNLIGGVAAVVALAAILTFAGHRLRSDVTAVTERPQAHVVVPGKNTGIVPPNFKPAPAKVEPKPEPKHESKPAAASAAPMIYNRVERGGSKGPEVPCTSVTPFAEGRSPAELAALAKQYEVPIEKLKGYFVCTN